jgi:hypothetical protein
MLRKILWVIVSFQAFWPVLGFSATELLNCPERYANGNRLIDGDVLRYPDGNRLKDGEVWRYPGGNRIVDGEVWRYLNGNRLVDPPGVWRYENGNRLKDDDVIRYPNGNRLREPDGTFRDANGLSTTESSRAFSFSASDGTLVVAQIERKREELEVVVSYDAVTRFTFRYVPESGFQPASLKCDVQPLGPEPTEFVIATPAARVQVNVNYGHDSAAVRAAIENALKGL